MLDPMVRAKVLLGRHFHDPFDAFTEFTPGTEHAMLSLGDFIRGFQVTPPSSTPSRELEDSRSFQREPGSPPCSCATTTHAHTHISATRLPLPSICASRGRFATSEPRVLFQHAPHGASPHG
jgi:hypothetical protein